MTPTFAHQIRDTRQAIGMTQAELADALDRSEQTISNWECGRAVPWPRQQVDILLALLRMENDYHRPKPAPASRQRIIDRI